MEQRRLTARGRERREELLAFATRRFAENGFHPTSVSEIVDGVGVGKGVFYWYFPSKDELLHEILRAALLSLRRSQQAAIRDSADPVERIELGIRASMRWWEANPDIVRLVSFGWTEENFALALRKGRDIAIADTARHVAEAMETGRIRPGDPVLLATAIRGVTEELARTSIGERGRLDDAVVDAAVRMCLHGIAGSGPEPSPRLTAAPTAPGTRPAGV